MAQPVKLEKQTIPIEEGIFVRRKFSQSVNSAIVNGYLKSEGSSITADKAMKITEDTIIKVVSLSDYDRSSNSRGNGTQDYATLSVYCGDATHFFYNDFIRNYEAYFIDNTATTYGKQISSAVITNSTVTISNILDDTKTITETNNKRLSILEKKSKRNVWLYGHCRSYGKRKK